MMMEEDPQETPPDPLEWVKLIIRGVPVLLQWLVEDEGHVCSKKQIAGHAYS